MRFLLALCLAVVCSSCGGSDSPTAPSNANLSGTWNGTITIGTRQQPITVTLNQAGSSVTGTWVKFEAVNNREGEGPITATVSGNTISGTMNDTVLCQPASATFNGTISGNSMTWNSGGFTNNRGCTVTPFTVSLQKQ